MCYLDKEIKEGRLCIRTDRDICNDVGLRDISPCCTVTIHFGCAPDWKQC
jgi:hypothetical protein